MNNKPVNNRQTVTNNKQTETNNKQKFKSQFKNKQQQ